MVLTRKCHTSVLHPSTRGWLADRFARNIVSLNMRVFFWFLLPFLAPEKTISAREAKFWRRHIHLGASTGQPHLTKKWLRKWLRSVLALCAATPQPSRCSEVSRESARLARMYRMQAHRQAETHGLQKFDGLNKQLQRSRNSQALWLDLRTCNWPRSQFAATFSSFFGS